MVSSKTVNRYLSLDFLSDFQLDHLMATLHIDWACKTSLQSTPRCHSVTIIELGHSPWQELGALASTFRVVTTTAHVSNRHPRTLSSFLFVCVYLCSVHSGQTFSNSSKLPLHHTSFILRLCRVSTTFVTKSTELSIEAHDTNDH